MQACTAGTYSTSATGISHNAATFMIKVSLIAEPHTFKSDRLMSGLRMWVDMDEFSGRSGVPSVPIDSRSLLCAPERDTLLSAAADISDETSSAWLMIEAISCQVTAR